MKPRVVFDTTTVIGAILFPAGRLAWLRQHWQSGACLPLTSDATVAELMRVLRYPKFKLTIDRYEELMALYLPYCGISQVRERCPILCRDLKDQPFLDLAESGPAAVLVSGDRDLLALAGKTKFAIETPEAYRLRVQSST